MVLNGRMLGAYSRRTITALRASLPLRMALPHLERVLVANVDKEVCKDALVIRRAAEALNAGAPPGREAIQELLDATKAVDREFLQGLGAFPVRVVIRYDEIAPLRAQRIEILLKVAYQVLAAWGAQKPLRKALHTSYTEHDFERVVHDMLRRYAMETRALSRAVRLPVLLVPVQERIAQNLFGVMEETGRRLAAELTRGVYRKRRGK
jgi:hypothetical protein